MHQPVDQNDLVTLVPCPRCKEFGFSAACTLVGPIVRAESLHMVTCEVRAEWLEIRARYKHGSGEYSIHAPIQDDTAKEPE